MAKDFETQMKDIVTYMKETQEKGRRDAEAFRELLLPLLRERGIAIVTAEFDGQGDSGDLNLAGAFKADNEDVEATLREIPCKTIYPQHKHGQEPTFETNLAEALKDLFYLVLETAHGGWEINEGAFGKMTLDVETGKITTEFNQRIEETAYSEDEF